MSAATPRTQQQLIDGLKALVQALGGALVLVNDALEDEGDRVYLGSSNHQEEIRSAVEAFDEWRIMDALPGVAICRHGFPANGSCELCHREQEE